MIWDWGQIVLDAAVAVGLTFVIWVVIYFLFGL
jgi:hypothetical protein